MRKPFLLIATIAFAAISLSANAQVDATQDNWDKAASLWKDTAGSWIEPHLYMDVAIGSSTGDPEELATGVHDPTREDGTVQGIDIGASLRLNDYVQGFATYLLSYGADKEWGGELEEAFLKGIWPDVGELRGGRMLSRFGSKNTKHMHSWDTVDMPLVLGRFLGPEGIILDGGDATLFMPVGDTMTLGAVVGYGERPAHDHAHGDDHGDEHGEEHDEAHGHDEGHEDELSESILASRNVGTARLFSMWKPNDFKTMTLGFSGLSGEDEFENDSSVAGLDFEYAWRENGLEPGGKGLRWVTEVLYRSFDLAAHDGEEEHHGEHEEEHDEHGDEDHEEGFTSTSEWGFYSSLFYTLNTYFESGIRLGWVEGVSGTELSERLRISPVLTYWFDDQHRYKTRLQYNYDDLAGGEEEHSIWLQFSVALGGPEVR